VKPFFFRCCKVTFETKRNVRYIDGDERHTTETLVSIQFEQATDLTGATLHGHAYTSISLSDEQYREYPYQVGKVYALGLVPETAL
jgi:hypothetical protein